MVHVSVIENKNRKPVFDIELSVILLSFVYYDKTCYCHCGQGFMTQDV